MMSQSAFLLLLISTACIPFLPSPPFANKRNTYERIFTDCLIRKYAYITTAVHLYGLSSLFR